MAVEDNLELLLRFEDEDFTDSSGNGRDGAIGSTVTFETSTPLIGSVSGSWDGIDDFLSFSWAGPQFGIDDPFTLAQWVEVPDRTAFQPLVNQANSSFMGILMSVGGFSGVGEILLAIGNDSSNRLIVRSSSLISNDTKHLVMGTYDGSGTIGGFKIYIDNADAGVGGSIDQGTVIDPDYSGIGLQVGKRVGDGFLLEGLGDDVAIWSRVLTSGERAEFYNGGDGWVGVDGGVGSLIKGGLINSGLTGGRLCG